MPATHITFNAHRFLDLNAAPRLPDPILLKKQNNHQNQHHISHQNQFSTIKYHIRQLVLLKKEACALQRFFSLMNEESPRKSLVKGERFVRHDDTSEGERHDVSAFPTTFDLPTLLAVVASLNLPNCKTKRKNTEWNVDLAFMQSFFVSYGYPFGFQKLKSPQRVDFEDWSSFQLAIIRHRMDLTCTDIAPSAKTSTSSAYWHFVSRCQE